MMTKNNEFELSMVNESSVFELLRFYCTYNDITTARRN